MPIDKKTLTETDLGRVDPMFSSTRAGYSKTATIVFTNGKSEREWHDTGAKAFGATFPSFVKVDEAKRECAGTCLVDLFAVGMGSFTPKWVQRGHVTPSTLSPNSLRYNLVISIVHELAHICQGWQLGKDFGRDFFEEKISSMGRAADYADMKDDAYLQNMFERGARDFAERWSEAHASEVHAGKFDFLLPMAIMRGMFPDVPNVFQ